MFLTSEWIFSPGCFDAVHSQSLIRRLILFLSSALARVISAFSCSFGWEMCSSRNAFQSVESTTPGKLCILQALFDSVLNTPSFNFIVESRTHYLTISLANTCLNLQSSQSYAYGSADGSGPKQLRFQINPYSRPNRTVVIVDTAAVITNCAVNTYGRSIRR